MFNVAVITLQKLPAVSNYYYSWHFKQIPWQTNKHLHTAVHTYPRSNPTRCLRIRGKYLCLYVTPISKILKYRRDDLIGHRLIWQSLMWGEKLGILLIESFQQNSITYLNVLPCFKFLYSTSLYSFVNIDVQLLKIPQKGWS